MKTRKAFDRTHSHLNAAQKSSAYHLTQVMGFRLQGGIFKRLIKGKMVQVYLHENGNALRTPQKGLVYANPTLTLNNK